MPVKSLARVFFVLSLLIGTGLAQDGQQQFASLGDFKLVNGE